MIEQTEQPECPKSECLETEYEKFRISVFHCMSPFHVNRIVTLSQDKLLPKIVPQKHN